MKKIFFLLCFFSTAWCNDIYNAICATNLELVRKLVKPDSLSIKDKMKYLDAADKTIQYRRQYFDTGLVLAGMGKSVPIRAEGTQFYDKALIVSALAYISSFGVFFLQDAYKENKFILPVGTCYHILSLGCVVWSKWKINKIRINRLHELYQHSLLIKEIIIDA